MKTLVRFFNDNDDKVKEKYENVIIPRIGETVIICGVRCLVKDILYDYSDCMDINGHILIDITTTEIKNKY